jgi:hypothetical protein
MPIRRHAISSIEQTFSNRQASVDRLQNALVIVGVEPVIGLHRDDGRAQAPRIPNQGAGLDAERLGRVAGGDGDG